MMRTGQMFRSLIVAVLTISGLATAASSAAAPVVPASISPAVHVVGNRLVNAAGQPVRLLGVNRAGTESACAYGDGIFSGTMTPSSIQAIRGWNTNAVRIPLNEECWLGINGIKPRLGGAHYQSAIAQEVAALNAHGLVAILDLHWNSPGNVPSWYPGVQEMADADHSIAFWSSVASHFRSVPGVVYELYNEPEISSWQCWLDGGCTVDTTNGLNKDPHLTAHLPNRPWRVAGMQQMLDAVRAAGARQPVMVNGLSGANDLSGWLAHEPNDPLHQLLAGFHVYWQYGLPCTTISCWNSQVLPVAHVVPVVTTEFGQSGCAHTGCQPPGCAHAHMDVYMAWADQNDISYLPWTWDTWSGGCVYQFDLISSYRGVPTLGYGSDYQAHLDGLAYAQGAPAAPQDLTATGKPGAVTLRWQPPAGPHPVGGYDLYASTQPGGEGTQPINPTPLPPSTTSYTATQPDAAAPKPGATTPDTYYFTVVALNGAGYSVASNEASASPF